jgi:hypothetical protein
MRMMYRITIRWSHHPEDISMRKHWQGSALSLALVLGACGTRQEQTSALPDDLQKDLAVASSSAGDLATAPQRYQRMRFVSGVEQFPGATPARRPKAVHQVKHSMASRRSTAAVATDVAPDPVVAMTAEAPAPAAAAEAPAPEPTVIVQSPAPAPASAPSGSSEGAGDRGHGGGLGGLLGGIIGAVVIRGGAGGVDHCDPRTDGRARPPISDRPDFGMPVPTGRVLGGVFRH